MEYFTKFVVIQMKKYTRWMIEVIFFMGILVLVFRIIL